MSPVESMHTKSAAKRNRQSTARRIKNRAVRSVLKTLAKKTRAAAAEKSPEVKTQFSTLTKAFDQAAAKGVIHKNKAARLKSRLSSAIKRATSKSK